MLVLEIAAGVALGNVFSGIVGGIIQVRAGRKAREQMLAGLMKGMLEEQDDENTEPPAAGKYL